MGDFVEGDADLHQPHDRALSRAQLVGGEGLQGDVALQPAVQVTTRPTPLLAQPAEFVAENSLVGRCVQLHDRPSHYGSRCLTGMPTYEEAMNRLVITRVFRICFRDYPEWVNDPCRTAG